MMSTQVLAKHGKSFHFAGQVLSEGQFAKAANLYALCRLVDDIADETEDKTAAARDLKAIERAIREANLANPVARSALSTLSPLGRAAFIDLIDGVAGDTQHVLISTETELLTYCYKVAGTVGLMMCDVLDVTDQRAYEYAVALGVGMQLTNIARDVLEDAMMGRRYLPTEWVNDLTPAAIINSSEAAKRSCPKAIAALLRLADEYYSFADKGLVYLPFRARLAITLASRVYREIGVILLNERYCDPWSGRVVTSKPRKLAIACTAIISLLVRPSFYLQRPPKHLPRGLQSIRHLWTPDRG